MPALPPEIQTAIATATQQIKDAMAKLKIKGSVVIVIDAPPNPPTGLVATPSLTGIALAWAANTEPDLAPTPYRVYRNGTLVAGPQSGRTYADATAHAGQAYAYTLTASDAAGNESAPATATATRPVPPALTNFTAVRAPLPSGNVLLGWSASIDPAHASYVLKRSADGGATFPVTVTANGATATDSAATPNVELLYRLIDQNSNGDQSPPVDVKITVDTAAPNAVTNLRVTSTTTTSISLAWDAVTDPGLAGYKVERSTAGAAFTVLASLQSPTTYTDTTAAAGFPYVYRVSAIDTSNNVSAPATIAASIPAPPAAPTNLTASGSTSGIALSWSAVTGAVGYRVYSSPTANGTFALIGSPTATSYNDTAAAVGQATYYQVRAIDAMGQLGAIATTSATRPAPGGTSFFTVGIGMRAQTAATVTASPLGHATHFNALALVGGGDWRTKRFIWNFGEAGTQLVTDYRRNVSVDLNTGFNLSNPCPAFVYTTAGQKNVTLSIVNEDQSTTSYAVVVNVPPAGRAVIPVGPSRALKTLASVSAAISDNTEFVFDAGTYNVAVEVPLKKRNVVLRAATPGTVTFYATRGANFQSNAAPGLFHSMWSGETFDCSVYGITYDGDYDNLTTAAHPPTPGLTYKGGVSTVTLARGENVTFVDCQLKVVNEGWKTGGVDLSQSPPVSQLNGYMLLRCKGTDPIGVAMRTFWLEGFDIAVIGCIGLNSINESTIRNANTRADRLLIDFNSFAQVLDPAHSRSLAKAASTMRAWNVITYQRNKISDANCSFDPLGVGNFDSYGVVDSNLIVNGELQPKGNTDHLICRNNIIDVRSANQPGIDLVPKLGMPLVATHIVNNTILGNFPTQPAIVIEGYNAAATPKPLAQTVLANNLYVNPSLQPTPGKDGAAFTLYTNDRLAYDLIAGNLLPDVLDSAGGKQLVTVKNLTTNGLLTLLQWNAYKGGVDGQANVTLDGNFAPAAGSIAATFGQSVPAKFRVPPTDYYGQPSQPGRVGAVNPLTPIPPPDYTTTAPYPWVQDANGWTVPPAPQHTYYIDGDGGNDANPGTDPAAPAKTTTKIIGQLVAGDRVCLKRGSHNGPLTTAGQSGWIQKNHVQVMPYGTGARPIITAPANREAIHIQSHNCFVFGLDIRGDQQSTRGLVVTGNGHRIEGCTCTRHNQGANIFASESVTLYRCNFSRCYRLNQLANNPAVGIYTQEANNLLLDTVSFIYNGWDGVDAVNTDSHQHGVYENDGGSPPPFYPFKAVNCFVAENASNGIMGRSPGVIDDCFGMDNGIHGDDFLCGGPYSEVKNCVVTGALDKPAVSTPRGIAITVGAQNADVQDNLIVHSAGPVGGGIAINIITSNGLPLNQGTVNIYNNRVIDWQGTGLWFDQTRKLVNLHDNTFSVTGSGTWTVNYRVPPTTLASNNNAWGPAVGAIFRTPGTNNTLAQWKTLTGDVPSSVPAATTWSATIEGYAASCGLAASGEALIARVEANGPDNWDDRFTPAGMNPYMRAGH